MDLIKIKVESTIANKEIYLADISAYKASIEAEAEVNRNAVNENIQAANIGLKTAELALQASLASMNASLEGLKSAGNIQSQLASSSLSTLHLAEGLSQTWGVSTSETHAYADQ